MRGGGGRRSNKSNRRLLEALLLEIYGGGGGGACGGGSSSASEDSGGGWGPCRPHPLDASLCARAEALRAQVGVAGAHLARQLRVRDSLRRRSQMRADVVTAILRAIAASKGEEARVRFSVAPPPSDSGFAQWRDAMRMVAKLPGGIPPEFRRRLWLTLAERHLAARGVDWAATERVVFSDTSNPDDEELGVQIVKDLHRTGCSLFCGVSGEQNQVLLKRVLLAYARWNKNVGYCQGFNMLAALILQVMDRNEADSVKVMILLIEGVLPESYFANNLRGLSVDMAVFRELLRMRLPRLSNHLDALQTEAAGGGYEPPLTNVFTMQWFLTLFANCLPQNTVFRLWDLVFLEGNEVLLRAALAIWSSLQERILSVDSADEFYSIMGVLTREMNEFGLSDPNQLVVAVVAVEPVTELSELRDRFTYNITPWAGAVGAARRGLRLLQSDEDTDEDLDEDKMAVTAAFGLGAMLGGRRASVDRDRLNLDISALKQQYSRLRERQRQAHIIISAACARPPGPSRPVTTPVVMNHLLLGRTALKAAPRRPSAPALTQLHTPQRPAAAPQAPRRASGTPGGTIRWHELRTGRSPSPTGRSSSSTSTASSDTEPCDSDASDTEGAAAVRPTRTPPPDLQDTSTPDKLDLVPPESLTNCSKNGLDTQCLMDRLEEVSSEKLDRVHSDRVANCLHQSTTDGLGASPLELLDVVPSDRLLVVSADQLDTCSPERLDPCPPDPLDSIPEEILEEITPNALEEILMDRLDICSVESLNAGTSQVLDNVPPEKPVDASETLEVDLLNVYRPSRPITLETCPEEVISPLDSPFELMPVSPVPPAIPAVLSPVPLTESEASPVQDAPLLSMPSSSLSSMRVSSLDVSSLPSVLLSPDSVLSDGPSPERCKPEDSPSSASLDLLLPVPDTNLKKPKSLPSLSPDQASSQTESSSPDFSFPLEGVQQITLPPAISPIPSPVHSSTAPPSDASDLFFTDSSKTLEDATSLVESDLSSLDAFLARPIQVLMDVTPVRTPSDGAEMEPSSKCSVKDEGEMEQENDEYEPVRFSNFQFFSPPEPEEVSGQERKLSQPPERPLLVFDEPPVNSTVLNNKPDPLDALSEPVQLLFHDALSSDVPPTCTNNKNLLSPKSSDELNLSLDSIQQASEVNHHEKTQDQKLCSVQTVDNPPTLEIYPLPECPQHQIPPPDASKTVQLGMEIPTSHEPEVLSTMDVEEAAAYASDSVRGDPDGHNVPDLLLPTSSCAELWSPCCESSLVDVSPPRALSPLSPMVEGGGARKRWSIASCGGEGTEEGAERRARALQVIQENSEMLQRIVQQPPPGAAWGRALSEEGRGYSPFPSRRPPSREAGLRLGLYPK